jgi:pimeloyl-ACP methyl ester carboxylesterase
MSARDIFCLSERPQQAVVLVHGLWMKKWTWASYRRFLSQHGYKVYLFGYKTTRQPFERSIMQLTAFVNSREEQTVHLVVHSMGGILTMRALPRINKKGKLLMLGSPINGSKVAQKLAKMGWHHGLLKHATEPLTVGISNPYTDRPTMMIAGTSPYGMGRFIERKLGVSDGTVALDETEADWVQYHQKIHSSHFGLLRNKQAKQLTLDFLNATQPKL